MEAGLQKNNFENTRVRMAPSPTGFLHIGSVRTTLFNYLFAKHYKGTFVLRIEDTDVERSTLEFEKDIIENLKWLGIDWDEGPEKEGQYGPYKQSQRLDIYKQYLQKLLDEDKAYYCFCTEEELEAQYQDMASRGLIPKYSGHCDHFDIEEIKQKLLENKSAVIRFRMPNKIIEINDLVRGHLKFDTSLFGDIIIAKNINEPLYNFAVVIDDYLMKITHVIRGDDHISNTPKQIVIAEALDITPATYAHISTILGPDKTRLSKRHGSTSIASYKQVGYLPEALINFIALMGWHPSGDQEIFSLEQLIDQFTVERLLKSPAIFNIQKLDFFNNHYLQKKSPEEMSKIIIDFLLENKVITKQGTDQYSIKDNNLKINESWFIRLSQIETKRIKKLSDFLEFDNYLFQEKISYEPNLLNWKDALLNDTALAIDKCIDIVSEIEEGNFKSEFIQIIFDRCISENQIYQKNRGLILWPLRVALSGKKDSAGPYEILELIGKELSLKRLQEAKKILR